MKSIDFLAAIQGAARPKNGSADRKARLATIDPAYVASSYPGTLPRLTFDGEDTLSVRGYVALAPYIPTPGHRVVLLPIGNSYVILGSVP